MTTTRYEGEGVWRAVGEIAQKNCDTRYVVGELYRLEVTEERDARQHNLFFKLVHEAWSNLPEHLALRFPTADHLRKYALIKRGFCTTTTTVWSTPKDARQYATAVEGDEFTIVVINDCVVEVTKANSQRIATMRKDKFTASSNAVLDFLEEMLGAKPGSLRDAA